MIPDHLKTQRIKEWEELQSLREVTKSLRKRVRSLERDLMRTREQHSKDFVLMLEKHNVQSRGDPL